MSISTRKNTLADARVKHAALHAEFTSNLERLLAASKKRSMLSPHPLAVNWGDVGTMERYCEVLRQITDSVFLEGEFAEDDGASK